MDASTDTSMLPVQTAQAGKHFALAARAGVLTILVGYAMDVALSQLVLPASGLDATMAVSTTPNSEDPYSTMGFLSLGLLDLGHALLLFSLLLWVLGKPGFLSRVGTDGRDQIAAGVGLDGLLGLFTLFTGSRQVGMQALTYVDTIAVDLLAVIAISAGAWVRLGGRDKEEVRRTLVLVIVSSVVTGLSSMAIGVENSWLVAIAAAATLMGLRGTSQLLDEFVAASEDAPASKDADRPGPSL